MRRMGKVVQELFKSFLTAVCMYNKHIPCMQYQISKFCTYEEGYFACIKASVAHLERKRHDELRPRERKPLISACPFISQHGLKILERQFFRLKPLSLHLCLIHSLLKQSRSNISFQIFYSGHFSLLPIEYTLRVKINASAKLKTHSQTFLAFIYVKEQKIRVHLSYYFPFRGQCSRNGTSFYESVRFEGTNLGLQGTSRLRFDVKVDTVNK